jgi:hypothetical protein
MIHPLSTNTEMSYMTNYLTTKYLKKLQPLEAVPISQWSSSHTKTYITLDTIVTSSMLHPENKCCISFSTKYDWSPSLKEAVFALQYLILYKKKLINLPISHSYLNTCVTLGFQGGPPHITSLPSCLTYISAARKN